MAALGEKHVSFEEPLLVRGVDSDENVEPPVDKKRTRYLALGLLAVVFIGILVGGPTVRACSHHMNRRIQHKHAHVVKPATHHRDLDSNLKPSFPNVERTHHVDKRADPGPLCTTRECVKYAAEINANLAANYTAIDPCVDFSTYVCGGWRERHDYRADQAAVDVISTMEDVNQDLLHEILEGQYVGNASLSANTIAIEKENFGKMKSAYKTCMNEDAIKAYGVKPVRDLLEEFEKVYPMAGPEPSADKEGLTKALIWLKKNSVNAIVNPGVTIDAKDPDTTLIYFASGEKGMGTTRQLYDKPALVANYTRMVSQMFQIIWTGQPIPNASLFMAPEKPDYTETAKLIAELETKMIHATPERQVTSHTAYYYRPTSIAEMEKVVPEIDFTKLINELKPAAYTPKFIMNQDYLFFGNLSTILKSTSRKAIHGYMQFRLISHWGGRLAADYRWPARVFSNLQAGRDPFAVSQRWRVCLSEVDGELEWLLSAAYVEKAFSQDAKALGDRIIKDIKAEFTERLKKLDWMSPATKEKAAKKVVNIRQKIGYPTASPNILDPVDLQKFYANLTISDNWFENGRAAFTYTFNKDWSELLAPWDRNAWQMSVPSVNAYYSPSGNEIAFPAGIMQNPVFGDQLPEYVSYGAFGSVAGHELTHGFDNDGAHYDERGVYQDWWDNTTVANFNKKTQCFVDQFNKYSVIGSEGKPLNVNGKLTLGENIADTGGINAAYAAWQKRNAAKQDRHIAGLEQFTREQAFFVAYGNFWCGKARPSYAEQQIYADVHSPTDARIMGTLANTAGFKEAFQCKDKKPTCELW
ncbi:endothelin-converting enzyme [Venturia nashicola]|uniref:Endothelin-converting enzyme n=1 Tax=Venturia nashicola TaxID=86259 RepID=A0A4Z1PHA4_9PEZI|nr:endothelin-converting enzyme [Venturia nashicola]TLD35395.1 endothelin-converting enzyme [Venturia nashicola]